MILSSSTKLLLLLSLTAILSVKANPRRHSTSLVNDQRVVGGHEILEPVPFMVSMLVDNKHNCGGSILNERTVLSAAHCYFGFDRNDYRAHVGDNTFQLQKGRILGITDIHLHPKYDHKTLDNDVAILRLNESLHFNERVQPIPLIESDAMLNIGSKVTVYGWGRTADGASTSKILKFAEISLIDHELCKRLMHDKGDVTENMFCAGELAGKVGTCNADSGGPLVQNGRVIGIVSWGDRCANPNRADVYTDVRRVLPWIKETLNREYGESL